LLLREIVTSPPPAASPRSTARFDPTLAFSNDSGLLAGAFGGSLAARRVTNVGSYAINLGTLSAGPNYSLSLSTPTVNFAITPATLAVTVTGSQAYGGSPLIHPGLQRLRQRRRQQHRSRAA